MFCGMSLSCCWATQLVHFLLGHRGNNLTQRALVLGQGVWELGETERVSACSFSLRCVNQDAAHEKSEDGFILIRPWLPFNLPFQSISASLSSHAKLVNIWHGNKRTCQLCTGLQAEGLESIGSSGPQKHRGRGCYQPQATGKKAELRGSTAGRVLTLLQWRNFRPCCIYF